jgi:pyruvate,water dikinase
MASAAAWRGLGVSPGVARGQARVFSDHTSTERILPGEILVAPYADPGWSLHFLQASAIVVDLGGMLSHGSIIARELGIPAVANVQTASRLIRTGQLLEVDGNLGTVRVLGE